MTLSKETRDLLEINCKLIEESLNTIWLASSETTPQKEALLRARLRRQIQKLRDMDTLLENQMKSENVYEVINSRYEDVKKIFALITEHYRNHDPQDKLELETITILLQNGKEEIQRCREYFDFLQSRKESKE